MAIIRISKEFTFEMAHALLGYDDLCKNIHGHSYTLVVTVKGTPSADPSSPKCGMLIDFSDLKKMIRDNIVSRLDHSLLLNSRTPNELLEMMEKHFDRIVLTDYQPTSENLLADIAGQIKKLLPSHIRLHSLQLRETKTSYAEWHESDNEEF